MTPLSKKPLFKIAAFAVFMAIVLILPDVFDIPFIWVYVVAVLLYVVAIFLIEDDYDRF